MILSGLWHGAGWTFLLWGAMHAAFMVTESLSRGFWRRAPALVAVPLVWTAVFLAWVPFRAEDLGSVLVCYRALGHGGWAPPSFGFLFGSVALILLDILRVRLGATPPEVASGWRLWAWTGRGALWASTGIAVAALTHLL